MRIERALIAVSDKTDIVQLATKLNALGIEILSTGGTAKTLTDGGVPVREVQDVTGFPEILGGRVKTLHPNIHGGILARLDRDDDRATLQEHGIAPIQLVIINLYPFERTVADPTTPWANAIEQIDIGGPAMIRAAAKNHAHVAVVTDPAQYPGLAEELQKSNGEVPENMRRQLAAEAYRRTAAYDAAISNWFGQQLDGEFPATWTEQWRKVDELRYGENPHQKGAWYQRDDGDEFALPAAAVSGEKALSYNNLLDGAAAIECVRSLEGDAAVIVKHCLPCGAAEREDQMSAFDAALAGDPLSAFGGIVAFNKPLSLEVARRIAIPDLFFEVIHAPALEAGAEKAIREGARWGKNCRILVGGDCESKGSTPWETRTLPGAMLVQDRDRPRKTREEFKVASARQPSDDEWADLLFAWRVIPFVRSNAILLAKDRSVVGVGAGQPSRVDSVAISCRKAEQKATGAVLASDAFFPFADGIEEAARAGVRAVVQPGGSIRDKDIVKACDELDLALVLTGERHFKH